MYSRSFFVFDDAFEDGLRDSFEATTKFHQTDWPLNIYLGLASSRELKRCCLNVVLLACYGEHYYNYHE